MTSRYVTYISGFILSIVLTLAAYYVVVAKALPQVQVIATIVSLAAVQLIVQLVCFLHLGSEKRPRWNLITFSFMVLVLVIIVWGSLWIMNNLNNNLMQMMGH